MPRTASRLAISTLVVSTLLIASLTRPATAQSLPDDVVQADIPILTEVYKTVHARRQDYTEHGLYPGMSRQEVLDYAVAYGDGSQMLFPNSLAVVVFTTPDKSLEVKATFRDQDKPYYRMLRKLGLEPDDSRNFAQEIVIVEYHDPAGFDGNAYIRGIREKYGEPIAGTTKTGKVQMIYALGDPKEYHPGRECREQLAAAGDPNVHDHAAALSTRVANINTNRLIPAMEACPGALPAYRKQLEALMGPSIEFIVRPKRGLVAIRMTYEAGQTFRRRYAATFP